MPWPLNEDFKAGSPMIQVPVEWFNTVSKILNYLEGSGCRIQKTATPGSSAPWRIVVDGIGGGAKTPLSDAAPAPDAAEASAGTGTSAARSDHIHPANVDDAVHPESTGYGYKVGTNAHYARVDHAHDGAPSAPVVPSSFMSLPTFWGEFSGASGGIGSPPVTYPWNARGISGHVENQGLFMLVTERVYIDNSAATPNLCAVQRALLFSDDGRLMSISDPFTYVISPTIGV